MYTLYSYWRSSASYRVHIALNLKGIPYTIEPVNILLEEHKGEYRTSVNPQGLVPTLIEDDVSRTITQSLAIIEYLDEKFPEPALLPKFEWPRARVRELAQIIACDTHPLQNKRVGDYLKCVLGHDAEESAAWNRVWIAHGLRAYEDMLTGYGSFSFGGAPSMADCCLIPQVYNALRYELPIDSYPKIKKVYEHCMGLEAFRKASPENQKDAPRKK
ncbi:MAG: maleylacetoacetate isomerase [Parcubacteria group bacterium]|nr:maleylacetoacetate isomerase [Parcubacteria group bacterium]